MDTARERETEGYDVWLWILTIGFLFLGTVMVLDASFARGLSGNPFFYFQKQSGFVLASFLVLWATMRIPYWRYRSSHVAFGGLILTVVLLLLVLVPHIGIEVNGARRWLGFGPVRFQPSELTKVTLVIFLARYS